ncbi:DUF1704 domain-containing protein [Candidatus Woesebacteria bacterium]|nr:DUF1704 domain-containing protein [Candidatus Woesebacteria bacterium]
MSTVATLTPSNVSEERVKFLASPTFNPQFRYSEPISSSSLTAYGTPKPTTLAIANEIIERTFQKFTTTELLENQGSVVSQPLVAKQIDQFLRLHNLEQKYDVTFSSSYISKASVTATHLKLRLPINYREQTLQAMLYHEVGTHIIRRVNYEVQPWFKKKKNFGFSEYLQTEEGLATLHARLPLSYKGAAAQALHYLAISIAQQDSFLAVWHALEPFVHLPDRRWALAVRAKRGMQDTSQPGGYTKDLLYLEGMLEVWHWLAEREFDVTPLYFGKLAIQDVDKALQLNPHFQPQLPLFFSKNRQKYIQLMKEIGQENGFSTTHYYGPTV